MVQVDVFWSYALGAGFALAANRQLVRAYVEGDDRPFESTYFTKTLLFLALIFAPSGVWLLWSVPSWETMHVGTYATIPGWLVVLFAITNVTQGILGYWVTYKLLTKGRRYLAFLQMPLAYFCMFFILVNGWDKHGYQRFFSATRQDFLNWSWSNARDWLGSDVVVILLICGAVMIPVLLYMAIGWARKGYGVAPELRGMPVPGRVKLTGVFLSIVFVGSLGLAVIAAVLINSMGWLFGLLVFAPIFAVLGVSKWGVFHLFYKLLGLDGAGKLESAGEVTVERA